MILLLYLFIYTYTYHSRSILTSAFSRTNFDNIFLSSIFNLSTVHWWLSGQRARYEAVYMERLKIKDKKMFFSKFVRLKWEFFKCVHLYSYILRSKSLQLIVTYVNVVTFSSSTEESRVSIWLIKNNFLCALPSSSFVLKYNSLATAILSLIFSI